jgi:hypothetical protein
MGVSSEWRFMLSRTTEAARQILKRLADHGVTARTRSQQNARVEVLLDSPEGIEIQLQDRQFNGASDRIPG